MFNANGPPKGFNVISDQSSYDLVFKDFIISSTLGTSQSDGSYKFNLSTDNMNQIYKAEVISAAIKFNGSVPVNIQNASLILSIPEMNGNTTRISGNIGTSSNSNPVYNSVYDPTIPGYKQVLAHQVNSNQGGNIAGSVNPQANVFCQIPDNNTPLGNLGSTNTISLFANSAFFDSIQFYNPPLNKINQISVYWYDILGNQYSIANSPNNNISSFYFTLRIFYFQKRNGTTAFSTSVVTNAGTGTLDSIFRPINAV